MQAKLSSWLGEVREVGVGELVSNTPAFQRAAQETRLFNRTGTTNRTHIVWIHEGC